MPRFVILQHHHLGVHWDFMLDTGTVLRTWRLEKLLQINCDIAATALPDHRRIYLDYEGEVSGGRGHVVRWDTGEFEWLADQPDLVTLRMHGIRLQGYVYLRRCEPESWTFRLTPDEGGSG